MKKPTTQQPGHPGDDDKMLLREVDGWVHHAATLERKAKVHTMEHNRPLGPASRYAAIKNIAGAIGPIPSGFGPCERCLTPRAPYQLAPQSYLQALGYSWSLKLHPDVLEWAEALSPAATRSGILQFWFFNVVPGRTALVSLDLVANTTGPGVEGSFEIRSTAAMPLQFRVTGHRDHIADILVRPTFADGVLVELEPRQGLGYLAFRRTRYWTR